MNNDTDGRERRAYIAPDSQYVNLDALAVHVLADLPRRWLDDTAPRDVRERSFAEARRLLRATFAELAGAIERGIPYGDAEDLAE